VDQTAVPLLTPAILRSQWAPGERDRRRSVLAIAYQFPPSAEIGAQSCAQIFRHLARYGWNVNVLTVQERHLEELMPEASLFPGNVIRTSRIPHPLLLYQNYRGGLAGEGAREDGGAGPRTDGLERTRDRFRRWILSMLILPDCHTSWIPHALLEGLRAVKRHNVDCIVSSAPWWTNHLVGFWLARWTGLPWVAHYRDPWTHGRWLKPVSDWSIRIEKEMEHRVLARARAVVTVTEQHAAVLRKTHPDLDPGKFSSIPNGYDGAEWGEMAEGAPARGSQFVITYAGGLYAGRSPQLLFETVRSLIDSGEVERNDIQIDLLGHCSVVDGSRVADLAAGSGIADQVSLPGFLSRKETLRRVAASNLLLLLAEDWPYRIPAKTYEYLRAGRPILAITAEEALKDLLERTGGAWVVEPSDRAAMAAALRQAYRCWREGGQAPRPDPEVVSGLDRRLLAGRLAEVLESTLPPAARCANERVVEACRP
jgi:glycosyltransferase involved in cell wall biosynthesis